jgi:hypothetical protein
MLRKTLITLVSVVALGFGSAAMAAHGGGGGGGGGHGGGGMGGGHGGGGAMGVAHGPAGGAGPGAMSHGFTAPGTFNRAGPMTNAPAFNRGSTLANRGMVTGPAGRNYPGGGNWASNNWHHGGHDHHHHGFHNRNFFAFGFGGGPYYDYAYDSCWVQTYYGWQYVCGDYPYGY